MCGWYVATHITAFKFSVVWYSSKWKVQGKIRKIIMKPYSYQQYLFQL